MIPSPLPIPKVLVLLSVWRGGANSGCQSCRNGDRSDPQQEHYELVQQETPESDRLVPNTSVFEEDTTACS